MDRTKGLWSKHLGFCPCHVLLEDQDGSHFNAIISRSVGSVLHPLGISSGSHQNRGMPHLGPARCYIHLEYQDGPHDVILYRQFFQMQCHILLEVQDGSHNRCSHMLQESVLYPLGKIKMDRTYNLTVDECEVPCPLGRSRWTAQGWSTSWIPRPGSAISSWKIKMDRTSVTLTCRPDSRVCHILLEDQDGSHNTLTCLLSSMKSCHIFLEIKRIALLEDIQETEGAISTWKIKMDRTACKISIEGSQRLCHILLEDQDGPHVFANRQAPFFVPCHILLEDQDGPHMPQLGKDTGCHILLEDQDGSHSRLQARGIFQIVCYILLEYQEELHDLELAIASQQGLVHIHLEDQDGSHNSQPPHSIGSWTIVPYPLGRSRWTAPVTANQRGEDRS